MKFNYFEDVEHPFEIYSVLPMFNESEFKEINAAIADSVGGDGEVVVKHLEDILDQCCCPTEKDSVCDFITSVIQVSHAFDPLKNNMIATIENAIYQHY